MTAQEAIQEADSLRPNVLDDSQKAEWVYKLDCEIAELMKQDKPEFVWPDDSELLMPSPHDDIYPMYLVAMIDFFNQDTALYQNDMEMFQQALDDAKSFYRRHNNPKDKRNWRTI